MADFNFQQSAPVIQELLNSIPDKATKEELEQLRELYEALTQSEIIPVPSADWPVSDPQANVIYRVEGESSYTDYMWNGTSFIPMATYTITPTDIPIVGSTDVITAGGVANHGSAFDISEYNKSNSTLATYADLAAALAAVPSSVQKGGMSIKFVQTYDNTYVQYRLMADEWSTTVADWQSENADDKPTAGSDNLVKSGGVKEYVDDSINDIQTSIYDVHSDFYKDSLYVSDKNGFVAFQIDENGQTKYVGKVSDIYYNFNQDKFIIADKNGFVAFQIDENGQTEYVGNVSDIYDNFNQNKFIIADKNGYVVAKFENGGASIAFKNPMNFLERKVFYTLGDSLSAANKYQLKLAEITGAVFDADANIDITKPISVGGTTTMGANATSGFQRARNLVSLSGNKDVVIIENINDMNHVSYGGDIDSAPYTEYPDGTNNGATKTLYGAYKWLCEYLITNLPSTHLFWMIPNRIAINYSSPETRTDGTIDMDYYMSTQEHEQYMQLVDIQKEVAAYYGIPVLDMIAESGINYINGGNFFYDNNVHPKDIGYYRWGETIARLLTSK